MGVQSKEVPSCSLKSPLFVLEATSNDERYRVSPTLPTGLQPAVEGLPCQVDTINSLSDSGDGAEMLRAFQGPCFPCELSYQLPKEPSKALACKIRSWLLNKIFYPVKTLQSTVRSCVVLKFEMHKNLHIYFILERQVLKNNMKSNSQSTPHTAHCSRGLPGLWPCPYPQPTLTFCWIWVLV